MLRRNSWNGGGIFHFWHVQDKNTLATLRFVQWTNRLYVQSNFSLGYRLYLAIWLGFVASPPPDWKSFSLCLSVNSYESFIERKKSLSFICSQVCVQLTPENKLQYQHISSCTSIRRPIYDKDLAETPTLAAVVFCKGQCRVIMNKRGYK